MSWPEEPLSDRIDFFAQLLGLLLARVLKEVACDFRVSEVSVWEGIVLATIALLTVVICRQAELSSSLADYITHL